MYAAVRPPVDHAWPDTRNAWLEWNRGFGDVDRIGTLVRSTLGEDRFQAEYAQGM